MTDTALQQPAPASKSGSKVVLKILLWGLMLAALSVVWFVLLANGAPERLNFSSVWMGFMVSSPPLLLTIACWAMTRPAPHPPAATAESTIVEAPAPSPVSVPPALRFRIGAWSALTPFGNAMETVEGTKTRSKIFKPEKAILHPSGTPVHAGVIEQLDLVAVGHEPSTRARADRVEAMLMAILDDLHAQQETFASTIGGTTDVFWLVPPSLIREDDSHTAIFDSAWKHSAWRKGAYQLQMATSGEAATSVLLSRLQNEIDQSSMRFGIVIAADSLLDPVELAPALTLAQVYCHNTPLGFIPSEGGAGILLFNPAKTRDDLWANAPSLGPLIAMPHTAGKDCLSALMSAALSASGKDPADIAILVSDSDHRSAGSMEVINAMNEVLAQLDPLEQRICPMEYAGAFGAASDLIHIVLGIELAGQASVLALMAGKQRSAAVVISQV